MPDIFSLTSGAIPGSNAVVAFRGVEAISRPYRFDIAFQVPNGVEFDLEGALGDRATLTADRGPDMPAVHWNGIIAGLELLREHGKYALYQLTMAPELWHLTLTHHSRVFTDRTVPEIISAILADSGITDFELRLNENYKKLEHVCQYKETRLAFIGRLMEREGIYYFFEQGDSAEKLIITDHKSYHKPIAPKPYRFYGLVGADASAGEAIEEFRCKLQALPKKAKFKDYDYNNPVLDVSGDAAIAAGPGELVVYGENFATPDDGARYAKLKSEQLLARKSVFQGHGQAFYLRPGYAFTLEEHPRASFNDEYVAIEVEHVGNQSATTADLKELLGFDNDEIYRAHFKAILNKVQFRAERLTPWPRIHGVVDGVIDGPAGGPYAEIDGQGRYKVRIFFDESGLPDGSASTWVRMLQPHGGSPEGFHFPQRKGTEVHIVFLGGDPDRPVIAGVAHNKQTPSAVTAANHTFNVIQTGGLNRVELDDLEGSQYIRIYCPTLTSYFRLGFGNYNFIAHTKGHGWIYIGSNFDVDVIGNFTEDVTGTVTIRYMSTMDITVKGAVTELFKTSLDTTVLGPVTILYTGKLEETVNGHVTKTYNSGYKHTVNSGLTDFTFNTGHHLTVNGGITQERFNASHDIKVTGTRIDEVTGTVTETYGPQTQHVKGTYGITADGNMTITAPSITINAPEWKRLDSMSTSIKALESKVTELEQTFKATSFSGIGLRIEGVIVDIKVVGLNVQTAVGVIDFAAFKLDNKPFKARTLGAKAEAAGPNIHITAITIYL